MTGGSQAETERRIIFREEVNGKGLDDWEDVCLLLDPIVTGKIYSTIYRVVADGIGDGPLNVGFGTKRYGMKLYKNGSTEVYSKDFKRR